MKGRTMTRIVWVRALALGMAGLSVAGLVFALAPLTRGLAG
jgi:hypothetical protein